MSIPATNFINHEGGYSLGKVYLIPSDGGAVLLNGSSATKHKGILLRNDSTSTQSFDITISGVIVRIALIGYTSTSITGNFGAGYILPCVVDKVQSIVGSSITGTVTLLL